MAVGENSIGTNSRGLAHQVSEQAERRQYEVLLIAELGEPGYSVLCPELSCASQGDTRAEALEMITEAFTLFWTIAYGTVNNGSTTLTLWTRCLPNSRTNPNDVQSLLERAETFLNKRDNPQVLADCDRVVSIDPELPESYRGRGDVHAKDGKHDEAIAQYDAALRHDPYDKVTLASLEHAYFSLWESRQSI